MIFSYWWEESYAHNNRYSMHIYFGFKQMTLIDIQFRLHIAHAKQSNWLKCICSRIFMVFVDFVHANSEYHREMVIFYPSQFTIHNPQLYNGFIHGFIFQDSCQIPNTKYRMIHGNNKSEVDWIFFKFTFYICFRLHRNNGSNEDLTIVIYTHFGVGWIYFFYLSFLE